MESDQSRPFYTPDASESRYLEMLSLLKAIENSVHSLMKQSKGHGAKPQLESPLKNGLASSNQQIQDHRLDLLDATQSLHDLALGPQGILESIHVR